MLCIVCDVSIVSWADQLSPGEFNQIVINDLVSFSSAFLFSSPSNQLAFIAINDNKPQYIYSSEINQGGTSSLVVVESAKKQITEGLHQCIDEQKTRLGNGTKTSSVPKLPFANAIGLAVCFLTRLIREGTCNLTKAPPVILCISSSSLDSIPHKSMINAAFTAKKMVCLLFLIYSFFELA
jgi:hypothetical protein